MTLNTVTVTWTENDIGGAGLSGTITFLPSEALTDIPDGITIEPLPKSFGFVNSTGTSVPLVATDNTAISQNGAWTYEVTVAIPGLPPRTFTCLIAHANGASQTLASLTPVVPGTLNAVVPGQFICPPAVYAPVSQTVLSVTSTTLAAWSSGNTTTGVFAAPPSGEVVVTVNCEVLAATSGHDIMFALAARGTVTPLVGNTVTVQAAVASVLQAAPLVFVVSGLTPGASYQFDLLGAVTSGDTASIFAFGATSLVVGSKGAPVVLTVQAV